MWAAAILASSWTEWIFVSKSNNPEYQRHPAKRQAVANAKIACQYVQHSIVDAMSKGRKIGEAIKMNYRPEGVEAYTELRKMDKKSSTSLLPIKVPLIFMG